MVFQVKVICLPLCYLSENHPNTFLEILRERFFKLFLGKYLELDCNNTAVDLVLTAHLKYSNIS